MQATVESAGGAGRTLFIYEVKIEYATADGRRAQYSHLYEADCVELACSRAYDRLLIFITSQSWKMISTRTKDARLVFEGYVF